MEEERAIGLSCALEMFKETDEVSKLVDDLLVVPNCLGKDEEEMDFDKEPEVTHEGKLDRFKYIIEQYREQPHLLDPHLPKFLSGLVDAARQDNLRPGARAQAFKYIFILTSVRGFKQVVRHLPHEVSDLVPVLELLESDVKGREGDSWETPYVCLLWLSIIILLPFPMGRLDSGAEGEVSAMSRITKVLKHYLVSHQSTSIAAGFLASKFLTRPDVMAAGVDKEFFHWAVETMKNPKNEEFTRLGALRGMNQVYKHGKREDLLPHASVLLREVVNQEFHKQALALRLMSLKLIQRIGLVFLKPKLAKWRYKRGCRSLLDSFKSGSSAQSEKKAEEVDEDDDDEYEIPEEVEEVIDQLLMGLKDSDSQVRWSSAKGIGRVTGRLPKSLADDVIGSLLDFFSLRESDSAWHGGCLALAELGRRGFLLPARLPAVVKVVLESLVFDEARGYYSVGINVRDAACYVAWSFARAYEPAELSPFVQELAAGLLVVCCFDREIKGRVAASAAFQENVGRLGTFPHGIDILTTADFVSVANRKNAFLNISTFVAGFDEYRRPLLSHLAERKVTHWDANIRDLASKALHNIGQLDPEMLKNEILPNLVKGVDSPEINEKHGSLLSLAESVHALAKVAEKRGQSDAEILGDSTVEFLNNVIDRLEMKRAFRLMGAHLMREASSLFILKCAEAKLPLGSNERLEQWLQHLYTNLAQAEASVREAAGKALAVFCSAYIEQDEAKAKYVLNKCLHEAVTAKMPNTRMGFSFALGQLNPGMMPTMSERAKVYKTLSDAFRPPKPNPVPSMILARRDALEACKKLVSTLGVLPKNMEGQDSNGGGEDWKVTEAKADQVVEEVFGAYLEALTDYTMDKPGDVGAWVRQAALDAIVGLVDYVVKENRASVTSTELGTELICGIAKQACERIDKVRLLAARNFIKLVHSGFPNLPRVEELKKLFPEGVDDAWANTNNFAQFVELVRFPEFRKAVLSGLVFSIGDVGQKASQVATDSLANFLLERSNNADLQLVADIFESLVEINEEGVAHNDERLIGTMMCAWDKLLPSGIFDDAIVKLEDCPLGRRLAEVTKKQLAVRKTGAVVTVTAGVARLVAGAALWCSLTMFTDPKVRRQALSSLVSQLGHKYPRVRKATAEQMYEAFVALEGVVEEDKVEELLATLGDTPWNDETDVEGVKMKRDRVCELLGVPVPVLKKKPTETS